MHFPIKEDKKSHQGKDIPRNGLKKQVEEYILISDMIDLKPKLIRINKEGYYISLKDKSTKKLSKF